MDAGAGTVAVGGGGAVGGTQAARTTSRIEKKDRMDTRE